MHQTSEPLAILTEPRLRALITQAVEEATVRALREASTTPRTHTSKKDWLTTKETAEYLGLSKVTLLRYRKCGRLPFSKVGARVYYRLEDVEQLLSRGRK